MKTRIEKMWKDRKELKHIETIEKKVRQMAGAFCSGMLLVHFLLLLCPLKDLDISGRHMQTSSVESLQESLFHVGTDHIVRMVYIGRIVVFSMFAFSILV